MCFQETTKGKFFVLWSCVFYYFIRNEVNLNADLQMDKSHSLICGTQLYMMVETSELASCSLSYLHGIHHSSVRFDAFWASCFVVLQWPMLPSLHLFSSEV